MKTQQQLTEQQTAKKNSAESDKKLIKCDCQVVGLKKDVVE